MNLRIQQRNVFPATACTAGTKTSATHTAVVGKGIRFFVTVSAVSAASTAADSISLCAIAPGTATVVVVATISGSATGALLTTAGTYVFDFYPSSFGSAAPTGGSVIMNGAGASVSLPLSWAVRFVIGTTGSATIQIDAEILP